MGATIGTIATEIIVCISQSFFVRKNLSLFKYIKSFAIFTVFGFLMFETVYWLGTYRGVHITTLIIQVIAGLTIYGSCSIIYLLVTKDEQLAKILKKSKKVDP